MARGDITADEVYKDREMLNRLGYGIFDVAWGKSGVGFENVRDFSYVVAQDKDPKIYRRKVFELLDRYYDNDLAKAMWYKFIDHKWVMSERVGQEVDLKTAAQDWFDTHGHAFLKEWTFRLPEVPNRIRYQAEPNRGFLGIMAGFLRRDLRELLEAGFSVTDIAKAAVLARKPVTTKSRPAWRSRMLQVAPAFPLRRPNGRHPLEDKGKPDDQTWQDSQPYLKLEKIEPNKRGQYYMRLVAWLTGHRIQTPEEAEKRWHEILEHKWYMSEREGHDVGLRPAALDYYRRLNLLEEAEQRDQS